MLLADEAPIHELDELRPLIAEAQERGFLTFEQIAGALEEVEVTKEQLQELHGYLTEQGIDVVGLGRPRRDLGGRARRGAGRGAQGERRGHRRDAQEAGDRPHGRAEPGLAAAVPALDRARDRC